MEALYKYLRNVNNAISRQAGSEVAELMHLNSSMAGPAIMQVQPSASPDAGRGGLQASQFKQPFDPSNACNSKLPPVWADVFAAHCRCMSLVQQGAWRPAMEALGAGVQPMRELMKDAANPAALVVAPMVLLAHNLRIVTQRAIADSRRMGGSDDDKIMDECINGVRNLLNALNMIRSDLEKRKAMLAIINTMLKLYYAMNQLHSARACFNTFEKAAQTGTPLSLYPMAQQVTYQYFAGRMAVYDERYSEAEQALSFALRNCPESAAKNRRSILRFLIPVKMLLGELPSEALLRAHRLGQYRDLGTALRQGNLQLFESCMEANQFDWIQAGTFLLLDKLRFAVYRRLLKLVVATANQLQPDAAQPHILPISLFKAALTAQGVDVDMDEVECILANLIYRKYVKGYIAHSHKKLVLSKQEAFPPISSAMLNDDLQ